MQEHLKIFGCLFIISLIALMVIPIGSNANNIFIAGFRGDYIVHSIVYLPWMLIGKMLFGVNLNRYIWFFIGILAVIALEYIQLLLPYRGFNINDIIAGEIGIIVSFMLNSLANRKK